jgi:fructose-bisphosphate aldolase class II
MTGAVRRLMVKNPEECDPRKFLAEATKAATDICQQRFEAFGSAGQVSKGKPLPLEIMSDLHAAGKLQHAVL